MKGRGRRWCTIIGALNELDLRFAVYLEIHIDYAIASYRILPFVQRARSTSRTDPHPTIHKGRKQQI
jgi:hypothetical protein